ncbi:hypothetical protein CAEBREN_17682 [Caenorhabditis brenneri]|uniref:Uncharacterized protein n=1 Tax=Caenorhabditis brenneri TaxID=135651 RepID=G0NX55_CAEBE|nr:hypothetical protein CAEBREN_17682 [Caenorhabditis brenneri]
MNSKPMRNTKLTGWEREAFIQRHPKYVHHTPMPKNPNRNELVIIDADWIEKNTLKRIANPYRTHDDGSGKYSYDSFDLKRHYLIPKHLEEQHRHLKNTDTRKYYFESELDAEALAKAKSLDVVKPAHSKSSSFSSGVGTSVEEDLEERSSSEKDESHLPYHLRTPTRPRSPSDPFNSDWDDSRIFLDPNVPQKDRYLQCTSSTCLCHKRHPSFKKQQ